MHENNSILAIIPARGGSKRLPRKNLLPLAGKPLIAWAIESGMNSKYIDEIVVSSDDDEIIEIAGQYKAMAPFKRPGALATDEASTTDVISHALDFFRTEYNKEFDYIVLLQPTSPLRNSSHIDAAIELLFKRGCASVISVVKSSHSPLWTNTLPGNGNMSGFIKKEFVGLRSQDLPDYFELNGAIYICKVEDFINQKSLFLEHDQYAYIMDRRSSIDIDDDIDFKLCELILNDC